MASVNKRRERILSLLPRIYTAQPEQSSVGKIVDIMASALSAFDVDSEVVMRERWINFASGDINATKNLNRVLAKIAGLLGVSCLESEKQDTYCHRVLQIIANLTLIEKPVEHSVFDYWIRTGNVDTGATETYINTINTLGYLLIVDQKDREDIASHRKRLLDIVLTTKESWSRIVATNRDVSIELGKALDSLARFLGLDRNADEVDNRYQSRVLQITSLIIQLEQQDNTASSERIVFKKLGPLLNLLQQKTESTQAYLDRIARKAYVLRAKWTRFLSANTNGIKQSISSFEALGRLLEIRRLDDEDAEPYRQRVLQTASILTKGLTSPSAILKLVLVCLGAEPCSELEYRDDATIATGMPLGTTKRCPVCQGAAKGDCPNRPKGVVKVWLIDNPLIASDYEVTPVHDEKFYVNSPSLVEDMPIITIKAEKTRVRFPSIQNRSTHEITFYAGNLEVGDTIKIYPPITEDELAPFKSYDKVGHHTWMAHSPNGYAELIKKDGSFHNISNAIYYFTGYAFERDDVSPEQALAKFAGPDDTEPRFSAMRFSDAKFCDDEWDDKGQLIEKCSKAESDVKAKCDVCFDDARFSAVEQLFDTPRIRRGIDEWIYQEFTQTDLIAVAGNEAAAISVAAPKKANKKAIAKIHLSWWRRPPATFRIHIPRNKWVEEAERRGAMALVYRNVERARAAGVKSLINICIPDFSEEHILSDTLYTKTSMINSETMVLKDQYPSINSQRIRTEEHVLGERSASFTGVFDTTRLDWSHFKD